MQLVYHFDRHCRITRRRTMRVSTRGRYGLRAMLELSRSYGGEPVRLGTLAEKEELSKKYLYALLSIPINEVENPRMGNMVNMQPDAGCAG